MKRTPNPRESLRQIGESMNTAHIKRDIINFGLNNILMIAAVIITLSLVYNTTNSIEQNGVLQTEENSLIAENNLLRESTRNKELLQDYYSSDEFLQLEARKQLGLVQPGEKVIIVPDVYQSAEPERIVSDEEAPDTRSYWQINLNAWYKVFFDEYSQ